MAEREAPSPAESFDFNISNTQRPPTTSTPSTSSMTTIYPLENISSSPEPVHKSQVEHEAPSSADTGTWLHATPARSTNHRISRKRSDESRGTIEGDSVSPHRQDGLSTYNTSNSCCLPHNLININRRLNSSTTSPTTSQHSAEITQLILTQEHLPLDTQSRHHAISTPLLFDSVEDTILPELTSTDSIDPNDLSLTSKLNAQAQPFQPSSTTMMPATTFRDFFSQEHNISAPLSEAINAHLLQSPDAERLLSDYLKEYCTGQAPTTKSRNFDNNRLTGKNRSAIRRARYLRYQHMFKRKKKDLADVIVNGETYSSTIPPKDDIQQLYERLFQSPSPPDDIPLDTIKTPQHPVWYPLSAEELASCLGKMPSKATGPDWWGVTDLRCMDPTELLCLLNLTLSRNSLPEPWKENKTTLIPKGTEDLHLAANWRPITISSVFARLLHRILASRLLSAVNLNQRQRAFIPADGCLENVIDLDYIIRQSRRSKTELNIVGIDISKAFDSVSHHSIERALRRQGIEKAFISYILNSYTNTTTSISCGPHLIPNISVTRGVKQGDPLSPILFNILLDELFDSLPEYLGCQVAPNLLLSSLGFADDLVLMSPFKAGMVELIRHTEDFFSQRHMTINSKKCFSLRTVPTKKNRIMCCVPTSTFSIAGIPIPAYGYTNDDDVSILPSYHPPLSLPLHSPRIYIRLFRSGSIAGRWLALQSPIPSQKFKGTIGLLFVEQYVYCLWDNGRLLVVP